MLPDDVARFIAEHGLLAPGERVLVGVSGGVDSVVLLHVLRRLGYDVRAAHVNYGLRGAASDGDEAFVRAWCAALGVPLAAVRFDTAAEAEARGLSVQEAARELRYAWFGRLAVEEGCPAVAVAHHRDDQVETVLLNLLRGSGPEGLAGMPAQRPLARGAATRLVRPLLGAWRADVEAYARAEGLAWRTDASNESLRYRRGALRHAVLPLVDEHFGPGARANVARAADLMRAYTAETLRPVLAAAFAALAVPHPDGGGSLRLAGLARLPAVWQRRLLLEALRRWLPGAPQRRAVLEAAAALVGAQPGRRLVLPQGAVWRTRAGLRFRPRSAAGPDGHGRTHRLGPGEAVTLPGGVLHAAVGARPERLDDGAPLAACVDAGRLAWPLTVRPWRDGDRFQPLGMTGTRKLSDFLTDARVPSDARRGVHVVCSGDDVVWVVGHRIDDRFRVRPETGEVARLSFVPDGGDG